MSYNADQDRDERGRWTLGGGGDAFAKAIAGTSFGMQRAMAEKGNSRFKNIDPMRHSRRADQNARHFRAMTGERLSAANRHAMKNAATGRISGGRRFSKERFARVLKRRDDRFSRAFPGE